jgi:predicted nucleic acid-binding protein
MAELYATLTRLPGSQRLSSEDASVFIHELSNRISIVTLKEREYLKTISRLVSAGIAGGAVYDALLAQCALKCEADVLYTWNVTDFRRLGPEIANKVRTP